MTDLRCAQLPDGMLDGLDVPGWPPGAQLHVAVDDDGERHVVRTVREAGRTATKVMQGNYEAVQRVGGRTWRVPVTAFWQAHRDAGRVYSDLVADWAQAATGMTAWDLYGGTGVFAAALGDSGRGVRAGGDGGHVARGDEGRPRRPGRPAAGLGRDRFGAASVDRAAGRADVAVLDPPRAGAGREVIDLLAAAGVPRIVHIGCEAASFARDVGLYPGTGTPSKGCGSSTRSRSPTTPNAWPC